MHLQGMKRWHTCMHGCLMHPFHNGGQRACAACTALQGVRQKRKPLAYLQQTVASTTRGKEQEPPRDCGAWRARSTQAAPSQSWTGHPTRRPRAGCGGGQGGLGLHTMCSCGQAGSQPHICDCFSYRQAASWCDSTPQGERAGTTKVTLSRVQGRRAIPVPALAAGGARLLLRCVACGHAS